MEKKFGMHDYLRTGSAGSMSHRIGRPAGAHQIPGGGSSREYSKKNDVLALSRVGLISFRGGLIRGSSCARRPKLSAKRICRIYVLTDLIDGICQIAACRALDLGLSCLPGTSAACLARSPCKRPLRGQAPDRHAPASDSVDAIDPHMHGMEPAGDRPAAGRWEPIRPARTTIEAPDLCLQLQPIGEPDPLNLCLAGSAGRPGLIRSRGGAHRMNIRKTTMF